MKNVFKEKFIQYYWSWIKSFSGMFVVIYVLKMSPSLQEGHFKDFFQTLLIEMLLIGACFGIVLGGFMQLIYDVVVPWRNKVIFNKSILKNIDLSDFKQDSDSLEGIFNGYKFLIMVNAGSEKGEVISLSCYIDIKRSEFNKLLSMNSNFEFQNGGGYYWLNHDLPIGFKKTNTNQITSKMLEMSNFLNKIQIDPLVE